MVTCHQSREPAAIPTGGMGGWQRGWEGGISASSRHTSRGVDDWSAEENGTISRQRQRREQKNDLRLFLFVMSYQPLTSEVPFASVNHLPVALFVLLQLFLGETMTATAKWSWLFSPTSSLVKESVFRCQLVYRIHIDVENLVLFNRIDGFVFLLCSWHS